MFWKLFKKKKVDEKPEKATLRPYEPTPVDLEEQRRYQILDELNDRITYYRDYFDDKRTVDEFKEMYNLYLCAGFLTSDVRDKMFEWLNKTGNVLIEEVKEKMKKRVSDILHEKDDEWFVKRTERMREIINYKNN